MSASSNGVWKKERSANYHLRGSIKAYRKKCFDQIGGLPLTLIWDFIDEVKAKSLGWHIKILPLEVKHNRKTSTLINRGLGASFYTGKHYYMYGYDLLLAIFSSFSYGLRTNPHIISGFAFLAGFISALVRRKEKDLDPELREFIQEFQYRRIRKKLFGRFL